MPKKILTSKLVEAHCYDKIAAQWGYAADEIDEELKMRQTILDYMVRKHIRSYEDVSKLVLEYFSNPQQVYRKARVS